MTSPKCLLPKRYFRIFSVDEIKWSSKNYYVVRRSLKGKSETFDQFGLVTTESLLESDQTSQKTKLNEIPGLSKNILGGLFRVKHLIFRPQREAMEYWNGKNSPPSFSDISPNVIKLPEMPVPIYFLISKIHKKDFPFYRDIDKEYRKKLPEQFKAAKGLTKLKAQTEVLHKPIVSNFWHVEFHVKDLQTNEYFRRDKVSSQDQLKALQNQKPGTQVAILALQNVLLSSGREKIDGTDILPLALYIKPLYNFLQFVKRLRFQQA